MAPSFQCSPVIYRPTCNYSKLYQEYDQDEHLHVVQANQICYGVECDWTPDCNNNNETLFCSLPPYSWPPVCVNYN